MTETYSRITRRELVRCSPDYEGFMRCDAHDPREAMTFICGGVLIPVQVFPSAPPTGLPATFYICQKCGSAYREVKP